MMVALLLSSSSIFALTIQHNLHPSLYEEYGKDKLFNSVGLVYVAYEKDGEKEVFTCSGFLMDPYTVLTSGHCVMHLRGTLSGLAQDFTFVLGNDYITVLIKHAVEFNTSSEYKCSESSCDDIGVLYLTDPVFALTPLKLSGKVPDPNSEMLGTLAGFGSLKFATDQMTPIFSNHNNKRLAGHVWIPKGQSNFIQLKTIAFEEETGLLGTGSSRGDSGGPLIVYDQDLKVDVVHGIISGVLTVKKDTDIFEQTQKESEKYARATFPQYPLVIEDEHLKYVQKEYKLREIQDNFTGYMSRTNLTPIQPNLKRINERRSTIKAYSLESSHSWSDLKGWAVEREEPWSLSIQNGHKDPKHGQDIYFDVFVEKTLHLDSSESAMIDRVFMMKEDSSLVLENKSFLRAKRVNVEKGLLHLSHHSKLQTRALTLRSELSGVGELILDGGQDEIREFEPHEEGFQIGTFLNLGGRLNPSGILKIQDQDRASKDRFVYIHDKKASMSFTLFRNMSYLSEDPKLEVKGKIWIKDGFLEVDLVDLDLFEREGDSQDPFSFDEIADVDTLNIFAQTLSPSIGVVGECIEVFSPLKRESPPRKRRKMGKKAESKRYTQEYTLVEASEGIQGTFPPERIKVAQSSKNCSIEIKQLRKKIIAKLTCSH